MRQRRLRQHDDSPRYQLVERRRDASSPRPASRSVGRSNCSNSFSRPLKWTSMCLTRTAVIRSVSTPSSVSSVAAVAIAAAARLQAESARTAARSFVRRGVEVTRSSTFPHRWTNAKSRLTRFPQSAEIASFATRALAAVTEARPLGGPLRLLCRAGSRRPQARTHGVRLRFDSTLRACDRYS